MQLPVEAPDETCTPQLREEDKRRIREEIRYVQLVLSSSEAPKSRYDRIVSIAGSTFVLALLGGLFTYFIGPTLQHRYDNYTQRKEAARECYTDFMRYAVSPFEEYYATLPLANKMEISEQDFDEYQLKLSEIHLRRYESYARLRGLMTLLEEGAATGESSKTIENYAVSVRLFADRVDSWLNQLRCEPHCVDDGERPMTIPERYAQMHASLHALEHEERAALQAILRLGER